MLSISCGSTKSHDKNHTTETRAEINLATLSHSFYRTAYVFSRAIVSKWDQQELVKISRELAVSKQQSRNLNKETKPLKLFFFL